MGKGLKGTSWEDENIVLWGDYTGVYIVSIQTEYLRSMYLNANYALKMFIGKNC